MVVEDDELFSGEDASGSVLARNLPLVIQACCRSEEGLAHLAVVNHDSSPAMRVGRIAIVSDRGIEVLWGDAAACIERLCAICLGEQLWERCLGGVGQSICFSIFLCDEGTYIALLVREPEVTTVPCDIKSP